MDTSAYLMELLGSFDADMSALSSESSSSGLSSHSGDRSSSDLSDARLAQADSDYSLVQSPPPVQSRHAPRRNVVAGSPLLSVPAATGGVSAAVAAAAAESKEKERASRLRDDEDVRLRYSQLKKNYKKQSEQLERTTKQYDNWSERRLDDVKRTSSRERMELEERVRSLEHRHALLESQHHKAQLEHAHALSTRQSELSAATTALRNLQTQLADNNPDVLRQIEYVKDDLTDLATSEAMYLEYKAVEPHRQTIREYVCVQVYELVRAERSAKESMQKETELIRAKFIQSEDEAERNARERDQIARLKKSRETELLAELSHLETLNGKLHDELSKKTLLINELSSKGELYDALHTRASQLEEEVSTLRQKDLVSGLTLKSLQEERESLSSRAFNLDKSIDLLRQDKMYLTKEVERLTECYRNSERNLERAEGKNVELKRQKEELVEKLVKVREEHQHSYEEKLNAELNRLQARTSADLESIRLNQREAYEREIKGLKESREQLATEHERLRTAAESTGDDYRSLQEEHRRLQSQLESERTDTRNSLKLKQFEYERLALTFEEQGADLRKLKIEHEVLLKKQSILKAEFHALQCESQKTQIELEGQVKSLTEKLSMYQQLEYELDMAILNAGGLEDVKNKDELTSGAGGAGGGGSGGGSGAVRGIHSLLESLGNNIPTANKRRMKQSILLAQQLVEKQKRIEVLQGECDHYKNRNAELDTELSSAKHALEFASQPHHYLIQSLQAKEAELAALGKQVSQLQSQLSQREEELRRCIQQKTSMEGDLHRMLQGKQHLDGIKQALIQNQNKFATGAAMLDQQFAAQQLGGGARTAASSQAAGAAAIAAFKENLQMHAQRQTSAHALDDRDRPYGSLNDPRNHFPHGHPPPPPHHAQAAQAHTAGLVSSQGRPTSSIQAHNQQPAPLASAHSRYINQQPQQTGDTSTDAQPKPLWFRKLTH